MEVTYALWELKVLQEGSREKGVKVQDMGDGGCGRWMKAAGGGRSWHEVEGGVERGGKQHMHHIITCFC